MASEDVLARLDALFHDVKNRRDQEIRKKYSYLDSPKFNAFKQNEKRNVSSSPDRRGSVNFTTNNNNPVVMRRGSKNTINNSPDRRGSSSTLGRPVKARPLSYHAGSNTSDYGGSFNSLDRRRNSALIKEKPKTTTPRFNNYINNNWSDKPSLEKAKSEKKFSNLPYRKKMADDNRRNSTNLNGVSSRRNSSNVNENGVILRRPSSSPKIDALKSSGFRRDSIEVEKLVGSRRYSYYDSSIPEEGSSNLPPLRRLPSASTSRFSPSRVIDSLSPRSSPSRSSPSRDSPSRTTPSRSTPPRPLTFGRIRRPSDLDPGPLDRVFERIQESGRKHSQSSTHSNGVSPELFINFPGGE